MWGLRQHTLLGIVVSLCGVSGNTLYWVLLLGLFGASGNTLYCVLLLVYVGPLATHLTGYCCRFTWGLGQHTLLGLMWVFSNGLKIIFIWRSRSVDFRISSETDDSQITPSQTKSYAITSPFPNWPLIQTCHNPTNLMFTNLHIPPKPSGGREYSSDSSDS
jgi:hypothetical protein